MIIYKHRHLFCPNLSLIDFIVLSFFLGNILNNSILNLVTNKKMNEPLNLIYFIVVKVLTLPELRETLCKKEAGPN